MLSYSKLALILASFFCLTSFVSAQNENGDSSAKVYKMQIEPHWFDNGEKFWYRNKLAGARDEYMLVDAIAGQRKLAFDHDRLAAALADAGVSASAASLPISALQFDTPTNVVSFQADDRWWRCELESYRLTATDPPEPGATNGDDGVLLDEIPRGSSENGAETELEFVNETNGGVELFWLDGNGGRRSYGKLETGGRRAQHTFAGHVWLAVNEQGDTLAAMRAQEVPRQGVITGRNVPRPNRRNRFRQSSANATSPNGKWQVTLRENNVFLDPADGGDPLQLTRDGSSDHSYENPQWSPDGQTLAVFRVQEGDHKEVYRVESSPEQGGRAVLHTNIYPLPGDRFANYELNLIHLEGSNQSSSRWRTIRPDVEPIDFGRPRLRWSTDGTRVQYIKVDRGHQRYRVIEVDIRSGEDREIVDEKTDTFIWTAHAENVNVPPVTWLENSDELIYASEVDGWRHLYLLDVVQEYAPGADPTAQVVNGAKKLFAPGLKHRITQGEYVVRGVDEIDETRRQIWFHASGRHPDQDPYFLHYYRVNFDGTNLVALTEGNGQHSIQYSPDRRFFIDTYSRVDLAPVHELRNADDGTLICSLEEADATELEATGWRSPEVFVTKGRDAKTDIWGIISWPKDFDPSKTYPVIEDLYAGPHSAYVPKGFSKQNRYAALNDLGFIVVKIDGMGTAHRSKAFHDVCWHQLKDAGFADRKLWIREAAEKFGCMDLNRVGVYGVSAGGQNAAAAVLFHGDFYKVAVAGCGCHDNRMDKSSWNEQWMGYPVGPQYSASSNIDNAHLLQGKLLLIVGEMDNNVPPESTLRFVDALIKADKDFEMLLVPGAGHGIGGDYGRRRMHAFFTRNL